MEINLIMKWYLSNPIYERLAEIRPCKADILRNLVDSPTPILLSQVGLARQIQLNKAYNNILCSASIFFSVYLIVKYVSPAFSESKRVDHNRASPSLMTRAFSAFGEVLRLSVFVLDLSTLYFSLIPSFLHLCGLTPAAFAPQMITSRTHTTRF